MELRARPATDAEYWVVVELSGPRAGRIVAQGHEAMCRDVERLGPRVIYRQGNLFDLSRAADATEDDNNGYNR